MFDILKTPNGANFQLADLHVHTPFDPRFRASLNKRYALETIEEKKQFVRDFFSYAMNERGFGILAITEHNDVSYLDIYNAVKKEKPFRKLILFPGIEISSKEGIHLLVLFNPNEKIEVIDGFLSEIGLTPGHRKRGSILLYSTWSFDQILDLVGTKYVEKRKDGESPRALAIAAHIDQDNGLSKQENARYYYGNPNLVVVQISKPYHLLNEGLKQILSGKHKAYDYKKVAVIESSDCRSIEDVGKFATYLKVSSPTIEGLKQAFLDTESRLRHYDEHQKYHYSRLRAARWEGGFLDGLTIHFNDNMNCLIGGKGTGKSTVIETIRYAFELEPRSPKSRENYQELLKTVMRSGSKISVLVESKALNRQYIIQRTYDFLPEVIDAEGNHLKMNPSDIMPLIEIYGQKEIYEISNNREFQLGLLTKFLGGEWDGLKKQEQRILNKLNDNKGQTLSLLNEIETKEAACCELPRLLEQLKKFQESPLYEKLAQKRNYEKELSLVEKVKQKIQSFSDSFELLIEKMDLDSSFLSPAIIENLINKNSFETIREVVKNFESTVLKSSETINSELRDLRTRVQVEIEKWKKRYDAQEVDYQQKLKSLQEATELDPNDLIKLEREITRLTTKQESIERDQKQLAKLSDERACYLAELHTIRQTLFQRLTNMCQSQLNEKLKGVLLIDVEYEGEKGAFIDHLVELKTGAYRKQFEHIVHSENFSIQRFVESLRKGVSQLVQDFQVSTATADKLYRTFDAEKIMDLELFEIPIRVTISLNTGTLERPNFKDTNHLSVGQKCTAILTLILMESPYPLIIDQPEDDLDNSFIFDDIVQKLRIEKEHRQFVIATHNANIPILGDAEQIIVLESSDQQILTDKVMKGSIDDTRLKEPVERILEGGKQAFELRKMKYGF